MLFIYFTDYFPLPACGGALAGFSITYTKSDRLNRAKGETLPEGMLLQAVFVVSQVYLHSVPPLIKMLLGDDIFFILETSRDILTKKSVLFYEFLTLLALK